MIYSSGIAGFYDRVNGAAYKPYADYLDSLFKTADINIKEVLDLGCGTGGIAALLADYGYDMVALDSSIDMLGIATERNQGKNTLVLCQDMREFELYGTVQAVYSSFDCLNYITETKDLKEVFVLVHNYLESGGLFVFDVNTLYRYENVYNAKCYAYEFEDLFAVWRSNYCADSKTCEFDIDIFTELDDGTYTRETENQLQRFYSHGEIIEAAKGFTLVSVSGGKGFDGCSESEKAYYIFRRN